MDKNLSGGNLQKSGERIVRYIALIAFLTIEETLELVGTATLLVVLSTYALRKWAEAEAGVCAVAEGGARQQGG